jgi:transcriptional regulator with XRE-family HTH domain
MLQQNIKDLRVERGLTQAQLAKLIGVTQGAVYFWEKGINEPTAGYLVKLARVFSVSVDELLSYESNNTEESSSRMTKMNRIFVKLSVERQEMLLSVAEELFKK